MKFLPLAFSICALAAVAVPARAATVTLTAIEDAFVSSANATSNYGGAGALGVAAAGLPKGEFDSLLKFNLALAKSTFDGMFGPGGWAIGAMTLQLTATAPNTAIFNGFGAGPGGTNVNFAGLFSLKWMQNDAWVEGTGTPGAPTTDGVTFATLNSFLSGADEALGTFSFGGATSGSNVWPLALPGSFVADSTAGNVVSLLAAPADSGVAYLASARSVGTAANRPQLAVTANAVPEPGAAALLGAGVFTFALRRRRDARVG